MADVLLTHSYHLPYDAKQLRKMQPYSPIGTLYTATALRESGISVVVFDAMLEEPGAHFIAMLQEHCPKIVAVYEDDFNFLSKMCLTRMRDVAWKIVKEAKAVGAVTVVHGSDSTDHPELFLENGFDYVLCGESEKVLVDLCTAQLAGKEVTMLDGLVKMGPGGEVIRSHQRLARNPDWANLSNPSRDLIDLEPYRRAWMDSHGYFSVNMVASRGCPFQCNWCAKPISGNRFHLRSAAVVAEEMLCLKRAGADHIWFGDDVFALNHNWVKDFAEEVTERDAAVPFKVQSRADLMSEETVHNLKLAGCAEVWMGVESGAQSILDAMDKGISLATIATARKRLQDAGIRACFFLQFGYPGEMWHELQQTIAFVREMRPDDIGISFSYPLPGTKFYQRVQAQLGQKQNWIDSDDLCIIFKAAYTTDFYRAVREALHAEVDAWYKAPSNEGALREVEALWLKVEELEPISRDDEAFTFEPSPKVLATTAFVPLESLS
ncbi:radical SAM protein [Granulicella sp. 5B5]|uniref:B12-binding domain-containing radical SAM protein n=1 Tax=Granulicella sp. 5B5 TaxID=1617967 RepID=UPI0015F4B1BD|nr:radical SAM protein [Granulicella sp. 5B5]QMV20006.1 radical SAM protein [Granulicella sp. 5B5]